ncbi:hypothetical protein KAFR_0D00770 [Kazachstania africana CBS 2517]|uniref:Enoyl reductase (ER) domain-containing protein n=1 Tax=Kazachstania africana (strain ATCC 22294 / BCRC 22015 / CBS 2517 / CECT 1963 / NBRC 1671 / NRRL Y-8276) TaxID=1071382 RepID=H2ATM4_KAZAF|nr:hypothetical protein KAFR_0D00770 [Kazachstania africana CBS 2517]CCF57724.1 hypothetical protein KAFR_0D00770 [Kazachstania africana CBS 2517]
MVTVNAKQWVLKTETAPGTPFNFDFKSSDSTFELVSKTINSDELIEGDILLETLYVSNDPAQKFWIITADKNYAAGTQVGELIPARGIGKVIASKNSALKVGQLVSANIRWTTHNVISAKEANELKVLSRENVGELWWYLSILGGTALTAYFIFYKYAELRERKEDFGKVFLISGAAGAVGSVSVQLAVNVFKASKVIAIAGGPKKVRYVESFGDQVVGVDYKDPDFESKLLKACGGENTVDYFIDNVGGEILDFSVKLLKPMSMILACGSISGYNDPSKFVFKSYMGVLTKRLIIKGLLLTDNASEYPQAFQKLAALIKEGKLNVSNSATIKDATGENFKDVPLIWNGLFSGINKGKLITKINDE